MSRKSSSNFQGFSAGLLKQTDIPEVFLTQALPAIHDLLELKVALYAFWFYGKQEGDYRFITLDDYLADTVWMANVEGEPATARDVVQQALVACCHDGILVCAQPQEVKEGQTVYFLNTPRGQAAASAFAAGKWSPSTSPQVPVRLADVRPNIFQLYEQNIGPLTPIIAEELLDAESTYSQDWIEQAIKSAVANNIRRWSYILAILRSRQEEGKDAKDQRFPKKDRKKYVQGEYGDFIEH